MSIVNMRRMKSDIDGLVDLINFTGLSDVTMAEVGSYAGQSAEIFLKTGKVKKIFCIDPWQSGYDANDVASYSDMSEVEASFDIRLAPYQSQVVKCKMKLSEFCKQLDFGKLDLVYIDGDHTYDGCKSDIMTTIQVLKPKFIAGHDFHPNLQAVINAVMDTIGKPDATFADVSWIKKLNYE